MITLVVSERVYLFAQIRQSMAVGRLRFSETLGKNCVTLEELYLRYILRATSAIVVELR